MHVATADLIALVGVAAVVVVLLVLEPRLRIPYPILLVLGGLALSLLPIVPDFHLPPDLVLLVFLPPLIYGAAFAAPIRDLRANARAIGRLAFGLVLATAAGVAAVAHEVMELPWDAAFVLGAVVAPTDPVAATVVARRLRVPRRLVAIIEGESLVNDATALVILRFAIAAVLTGAFSIWEAGVTFLWTSAGGVAIGLVVAWVIRRVWRRLDNPETEIVVSLLVPFIAYIPAEAAGTSAVLAAVAAGIYLSIHASELGTARTRVGQKAVWDTLMFVLNAVLFVLIGLQLQQVSEDIAGTSLGELVKDSATVFGAVIGMRFLWIFGLRYVRRGPRTHTWREAALVSWAGMRGAVSLAAALSVPLATDAGDPFPGRSLIIFTTFAIILGTLVLLGLSFPFLVRALGVRDEGIGRREEATASLEVLQAALARLDELVAEDAVSPGVEERLRAYYVLREKNLFHVVSQPDPEGDGLTAEFISVRRELLQAERDALEGLYRTGDIDDELRRRVEQDLDLQEVRNR